MAMGLQNVMNAEEIRLICDPAIVSLRSPFGIPSGYSCTRSGANWGRTAQKPIVENPREVSG